MHYYASPMEGLTGYIWRNAHHACFPGVDAYFSPFISPNQNHCLSAREESDLLPENNAGTPLIPQVLTNNPSDFIWAAETIARMGYEEVNLNLGCPSPTVVTKGKGSGMLADPDNLDRFLEDIFSRAPLKISVKTRLGLSDESLFPRIMEIFCRYPVSRLIIHPRAQADMYKKPIRAQAFTSAREACSLPLVYNGDLFDPQSAQALPQGCEGLCGLMFGRGLIANPALCGAVRGLPVPEKAVLKVFHDRIFENYKEAMPGDRALLFKMKELWLYMGCLFPERGSFDKKLKKAARASEYSDLVNRLFDEQEPDFTRYYRP